MNLLEILLLIGAWIVVFFWMYISVDYLKKKKRFWVVKLRIIIGIIVLISFIISLIILSLR